MKKEDRLLRVGVLGCGPIAQFAHFDACRKARNAELYAVCDVARDLADRMAAIHGARRVYYDYDALLADPQVEAILIGVADAFHVPASHKAIEAGKHVLVEKPLGVDVAECEALQERVRSSGRVFQVGNNLRFDPGIAYSARFLRQEVGGLVALKAWYCDSTHRYTMTDNLQPIPVRSDQARRPEGDPRADRRRYYLLALGSHLVDLARFLGGPILSVRARWRERLGAHCWFVEADFPDGALGHLDLTVPVRGDFQVGFQAWGEHGSVVGRSFLPWFHKAAEVECFSEMDRTFRRPLGEDAHTYKRQLEGFADAVLRGVPTAGAGVEDGLAAVQALVAISRSAESGETVRLADVTGSV
jgi:predicted dehydrogenase